MGFCEEHLEMGGPAWKLGASSYAFTADGGVIAVVKSQGIARLATISLEGRLSLPNTPWREIPFLCGDGSTTVMAASTAAAGTTIVSIDTNTLETTTLRPPTHNALPANAISPAEPVAFPSVDGRMAYGFYYAPRHPTCRVSADNRPPLLVRVHGGPTGATRCDFSLETQFWTTRGWAVLDVNYGGSTGYGRAYRNLLNSQWGVVDVEDCVAGVQHLCNQQMVDPDRVAISGGSAGGWTVLCALASSRIFKVGASYYGVSDAAGLMATTHKFEAHYDRFLFGPPESAAQVMTKRSPLNRLDDFRTPTIFFQGGKDAVVVPEQSEAMYKALQNHGLKTAYHLYPEEGHGFRSAANQQDALEKELDFYLSIFAID